jgi:hypothetical protein
MDEDKRNSNVNFMSRGMLCILDLGFKDNELNPKAAKTKWFLRKRILDGLHQIEYENNKSSAKEE